MAQARGRYLGMELELITPKEAQDLFPLLDPQYFVGALYDPVEGHVDPSGVTQAYVICARKAGAEVHRNTWVTGLTQRAGRHVGRPDRRRRDRPRRARRQRRWPVGPRGRPDGRHRAAGPRDGAPLPRDRRHARGRREPRPDRQGDADGARLRRRDLHPPGGRRDAPRHVRAEARAVVAEGDAVGLRGAAPQARRRADRARAPGRLQALPGDGRHRHPADRQRPVHVLTRWESTRGSGPRDPELLGRLRGHGRPLAGRRRGPGARDLDDRGRPRRLRDGYLGDGRGPLRRLRHARLHERQGPRELLAPLPDHVPERGAAGRPAAPHDADLRPPHGRQRGLGRLLRPGARPLVPGSRARSRSRRSRSTARTPGTRSRRSASRSANGSA